MAAPTNSSEKSTTQRRSVSPKRSKSVTRTPLQLYYIHRLENLITLRKSYDIEAPTDEWLLPAINKAIYSTYLDCLEYKVGKDAKAILNKKPHTN